MEMKISEEITRSKNQKKTLINFGYWFAGNLPEFFTWV